jgi:predicted 3-demethylubiquinone-9 3-methyltransferase (glyoxalase superfamily)
MQKIVPFLWFNDNAEEAVNLYVSLFKDAKILSVRRGAKGEVFTASFELEGREFMALNGGPTYKFTPAISLFVNCVTQQEVDELWEKLSEGGRKDRCGWLADKFGVSWQIVPTALGELMGGKDTAGAQRVWKAMLEMTKLDIAKLRHAYEHAG